MEYRFLEPQEYGQLAPIYSENGVLAPDESQATLAGAFEGDEVKGFLGLQYAFHSEPLWVHPEYRGKVNWKTLFYLIESEARVRGGSELYVFIPDEHIGKMAEIVGFKPTRWTVYRKEL